MLTEETVISLRNFIESSSFDCKIERENVEDHVSIKIMKGIQTIYDHGMIPLDQLQSYVDFLMILLKGGAFEQRS
jgi:hypothetical protein